MEVNHNETKDSFDNSNVETTHWNNGRRLSGDKNLQKIKKLLKLLAMSMAIFGIFRLDHIYGKKPVGTAERRSRSVLFRLHAIYCYFIAGFLCCFFIRTILAFFIGEHSGNNFAFKIIVATWSLQLALNAIIMVKASHPKWGYLTRACHTWDNKVLSLMDSLDVSLNIDKTKKILLTICIIGWITIVFNISLLPALLFQDSNFTETMAANLIAPIPINKYSKIFVCTSITFQTVAWMVPVLYLMAICFVIQSAFKVCKLALGKAVEHGRDTNTYPCCLYRQRMLHLNICQCLEMMDKDVKLLYANLFFTNIPLACFILYELLKTKLDALSIAAFAFWLASNILFVTMTTLTGAAVSNAAHSPLDYLYEVGTNGITLEQLGQLNLFTAKLNGGAIGFTVMTFVTVTKELFLTVGGLYLTYFFVLLQF